MQSVKKAVTAGCENDASHWTNSSLKDLIVHIVKTYHDPLRLELMHILAMAEKVALMHGDVHPETIELCETFQEFKDMLEMHMQKEEMILFPTIAAVEKTSMLHNAYSCSGNESPTNQMMKEHKEFGVLLCKMRYISNSYTPPKDACDTYKSLLSSLADLESEMHQLLHKENNILFPRAMDLFGSAEHGELNAQTKY